MMKKIFPLILFILIACPVEIPLGLYGASRAEAGSVQFSTYYPAPFGMYDRLRLVPRATLGAPCDPGTFYYETGVGLKLCDEAASWGSFGGDVWTQDSVNDYIYPTDTAANPNLKVGIGTMSPEFRLTLDKNAAAPDGGILATGTFGSGATLTTAGAGTRLIWYPRKAAFRAGNVNGSQWDDSNIGNNSIAMGPNTTASGDAAVAIGPSATASTYESLAIGDGSLANGPSHSSAFGAYATASGDSSTAVGSQATAQAYGSTVTGRFNIISGNLTTWIATDPIFVVGNGIDVSNRSNALTVLKNGNVGIGTSTPATSALLDLTATDRGFLAPRLTTAQRNAISSPATGLVIYNTSTSELQVYNGASWVQSGSQWTTTAGGILYPAINYTRVALGYTTASPPTDPASSWPVLTVKDDGFLTAGNLDTTAVSIDETKGPLATGTSTALSARSTGPGLGTNIGARVRADNATSNIGLYIFGPQIANANNYAIYSISVAQSLFTGPVRTAGGLIIETRTQAQGAPPGAVPGQIWLCTDCP